jgi:hypothetical protein
MTLENATAVKTDDAVLTADRFWLPVTYSYKNFSSTLYLEKNAIESSGCH